MKEQEKINLLNKLHEKVTEYSFSGDEIDYIYVSWDEETRNILTVLGFSLEDIDVSDGSDGPEVDITEYAFQIAEWWNVKRGFMLDRSAGVWSCKP